MNSRAKALTACLLLVTEIDQASYIKPRLNLGNWT
jgi:hypothetical protein